MSASGRRGRRIAIIGSGFSGLCLGIRLKQAGIESFTIFEKAEQLGGTWRDNTYPGAACDVPSFAYCFSFEQKTDWSRKWAPQEEIRGYMDHCARKYDLLRHIRFRTEIASARFDEAASVWRLRTAAGDELEFDVLVSGVGQLNRPYVPAIPGLESFRGERFHSARWNHAYDLTGKRVAVVGNAASAIQFIPQIAPEVERLTILQRSANWMLPRGDRVYTAREKWLFTHVPLLARLYRWWIWLLLEMRFPLFRGNAFFASKTRDLALRNIEDSVSDPELRKALVPDYPIGGKRILISDDYYPTLNRENVDVVTSPIERVTEDAVVTRDGAVHPVDAVILATGFESTHFLAPMHVEGRDGRSLESEWKDGARAYRGITVAGFPNLFLMYGPNTNLGHNSIIFMIECQAGYIVQAIRTLVDRDLASLDLEPAAMAAYDRKVQTELAGSVWAATPKSWYKTESGRITNNWSGTTTRYWWSTRRFDVESYRAEPRAAACRRADGANADAVPPARAAAA
ncbi:MAG TPA: NAD(P)/FAD-dependent oxidoreductase [Candidatus Binatia bacterium]|nr:NAD(P)/FAD-dependent oxidoreductase [Candidatus Binatia bacterium]